MMASGSESNGAIVKSLRQSKMTGVGSDLSRSSLVRSRREYFELDNGVGVGGFERSRWIKYLLNSACDLYNMKLLGLKTMQ